MRGCHCWNGVQVFPSAGNGNVVVEFCDVQGGHPGAGNLSLDPLFVDGPARDLRTGPGSPANDAADVEHIPLDHLDVDGDGVTNEPLPLDHADGRRRVDDPLVPDALGQAPAPDMRAYEFLPD